MTNVSGSTSSPLANTDLGKSGKAKQGTSAPAAELPPTSVPTPADPAAVTPAEEINWGDAEVAAKALTVADVDAAGGRLEDIGKAFTKVQDLEASGHKALAASLAALYEASKNLLLQPAMILALCQNRKVMLTKRSKASAFLPIVKLALPGLDDKTQSLYARALNFGLACGLDPASFGKAIRDHGVKELARRETARKRAAKGEPKPESEEELIESFRTGRTTVRIEGLDLPEGQGMALAVVGRVGSDVHLFAVDDSEKRLMAAIRQALRDGREPPAVETAKAAKKNAGNIRGNDSAGEAAA